MEMSDVFISYSRSQTSFVRRLCNALEENDYQAWVDWSGIKPSTLWKQEILKAIERSVDFLFIVSRNSAVSDMCREELDHAVSTGKRIFPIIVEKVPKEHLPESVRATQWISFLDKKMFSQSVNILIETLDSDLEWTQEHGRLLLQARRWEELDRNDSALLRGAELEASLALLERADQKKDRTPSKIVVDFVDESQLHFREEQHRYSRALGERIGPEIEEHPMRSLLLAVSGLDKFGPSLWLLDALSRAVGASKLIRYEALDNPIAACFSMDGKIAFIALRDGRIQRRNCVIGDIIERTMAHPQYRISLSTSGNILIAGSDTNISLCRTKDLIEIGTQPITQRSASIFIDPEDKVLFIHRLDDHILESRQLDDISSMRTFAKDVTRMTVASGGKYFTTFQKSGAATLWKSNGRRLDDWQAQDLGWDAIQGIIATKDGRFVALCGDKGKVVAIRVVDRKSKAVGTVSLDDALAGDTVSLNIHPSGSFLFANIRLTAYLIRISRQEGSELVLEASEFPEGSGLEEYGELSQDGAMFVQRMEVRPPEGGDPLFSLKGHVFFIDAIHFNSAGTFARTVGNGALVEWSSTPRGIVFKPDDRKCLSNDVIVIRSDLDGILAITSDGHLIKFSEDSSPNEIRSFPFKYEGDSHSLEWQTNDLRKDVGVVFACQGPGAALWRLNDKEALQLSENNDYPWAAIFLSDEEVITASGDCMVRKWRVCDGALVGKVHAGYPATSVARANNKNCFATGNSSGGICLFDFDGNSLASEDCRSNESVWGLAFSPDDKMLAATNRENIVLFRIEWDGSRINLEKAETIRVVEGNQLKQVIWTTEGSLVAATADAVYQFFENEPFCFFRSGSEPERRFYQSKIWCISAGNAPREVLAACGWEILRFTLMEMDEFLESVRKQLMFRQLTDKERSQFGIGLAE